MVDKTTFRNGIITLVKELIRDQLKICKNQSEASIVSENQSKEFAHSRQKLKNIININQRSKLLSTSGQYKQHKMSKNKVKTRGKSHDFTPVGE